MSTYLSYDSLVSTRDDSELELWRRWKLANETVHGRIFEEITSWSGLSEADVAVLFRVADRKNHRISQNELAASLRWHRSRLSHQLTRMERRGLLRRTRTEGVVVSVTDAGIDAVETSRPVVTASIRKYFIDLIPEENEQAFREVLERLIDGER